MYNGIHCNSISNSKKSEMIQFIPVDYYLNKLWYYHTMECSSAIEN